MWIFYGEKSCCKQHHAILLDFFSCDQAALQMVFSVCPSDSVRKLICLKGLRALPKNYYGNTTPSMAWSHHWRNVWRNIAGSRPNWAQDFTRTSQKNSRSSQKNYYQHSRNFGTSYFCLSYLLHKQAYVQLDEVTPVAGGLTLHSCYCN